MENINSYWQFGDELRGQSKVSEEHTWTTAAIKLAEQIRSKGERRSNLDLSKGSAEIRSRDYLGLQEDNKWENLNFNMLNFDTKLTENMTKSSIRNGIYNMNSVCLKPNVNSLGNMSFSKFSSNHTNEPCNYGNNNNTEGINGNNAADKRFKTLPAAETLPRNEVLGGYIFVCNNDTMQEDLKRQLFGNFFYHLLIIFLLCGFVCLAQESVELIPCIHLVINILYSICKHVVRRKCSNLRELLSFALLVTIYAFYML